MKSLLHLSKVIFVVLIVITAACTKKSDYQCTLLAGTVVTNSDGTQYTVTDTETKACSDCTSKDVDSLEDKGYSCK